MLLRTFVVLGDISFTNVVMIIDKLNCMLLDNDFDNSSRNNFLVYYFHIFIFFLSTIVFSSFIIIFSAKCVICSVNWRSSNW